MIIWVYYIGKGEWAYEELNIYLSSISLGADRFFPFKGVFEPLARINFRRPIFRLILFSLDLLLGQTAAALLFAVLEAAVIDILFALKEALSLILSIDKLSSIAGLVLFKVECAFPVGLPISKTTNKCEAIVVDDPWG